ncbi:MAG: riboflavin synthase [Nitrospinaceae bacterium]
MFTGIIESMGTISSLVREGEKARMGVDAGADTQGWALGESVAVNGVCLTVCAAGDRSFAVDLSGETLQRTTFSQAQTGQLVNLERSLTPQKKMSGHFVQGHVDGVGRVVSIAPEPGQVLLRFEHPPELAPYFIEKGSVAIDGISLTVFACRDHGFSVSIIPFTWSHTNLRSRKMGEGVNLECDMIGKYVVKTCATLFHEGAASPGLTLETLKRLGFA